MRAATQLGGGDKLKEKLKAASDEYFTIANEFALGENGLPKNGVTAVCLHEASGALTRALRALDDADFAKRLTRRQLAEHTLRTMKLDFEHPGT